ncbi:MAG: LVIVD repeat-containing protein [Gemmatimonadaceae bacterium]
MHVLPFALLLLAQQGAQQPSAPVAQATGISRIVISPATRTVRAGDTVQFSAQAFDASGAPIENVTIRFGGQGSGSMDSTGRLIASAIGKLPIVAVATVPGNRPAVERRDLEIIPAPAARMEIRVAPAKLVVGQQTRVEAVGYSRANDRAIEPIEWTSSAPRVVRVENGVATAVAAGRATLTATAGTAKATTAIQVVPSTITSLTISPSRPKVRTGDVVRFTARARATAGDVSGLTPTWAMQGHGVIDEHGAFVAYEPGRIVVTATLGSRSATTIVDVEARDVRRPVSVVGRLPRTEFLTAEVWIHPNGKVAYLGTHGGGDRIYTIDISNPAQPTVVDSVVMNTRLVNDVMTDKAGTVLVMTREGAADRKNGIVIASLEDPLHPKVISEFTEGVTAGVHSAFVYTQPTYGTHVYLTNDGTGAVHVIDINDPKNPTEVAQWRTTNRPDDGRYVHDIDVQDGLLYASYWDDGLIILDIGKGIKGGSPSTPTLVTQFKYNLDSLYRQVEVESGPGFTRGTHTAWRYKDYVIIADEVYRASEVKGAKDEAANRMYGTMQIIDVSDIEHPKSVAWYTPENGGVHNVWVAGDTLYMGAYDGGFHVFDISGELKGDLRAQGREIAFLSTADMQGKVQNQAMTWGVVVNPADGLAYVNDFHNGLWIVRVDPRSPPVP